VEYHAIDIEVPLVDESALSAVYATHGPAGDFQKQTLIEV
jgi:hypothetical protein